MVLADRVAPGSSPSWTKDRSRVFYLVESGSARVAMTAGKCPCETDALSGNRCWSTPNLGSALWARPVGAGLVARLVRSMSSEVYTRTIDLTGTRAAGPPATYCHRRDRQPRSACLGSRRSLVGLHRDSAPAIPCPCKPAADTLMVLDTVTGARREVSTTLSLTLGHQTTLLVSGWPQPDGLGKRPDIGPIATGSTAFTFRVAALMPCVVGT